MRRKTRDVKEEEPIYFQFLGVYSEVLRKLKKIYFI